jgi:hypothetical protein
VENYHFAKGWIAQADNAHERAEYLLTGANQNQLTEAEKIRDGNLLRQIQHRRMLLRRSDDVIKVVKKHSPAILQPDRDVEAKVVSD